MQIAITLLLSAMSLLTQINSIPNISPELKLKAENVANFAIDYANKAIAEEQSKLVVIPTEIPLQTFGSMVQSSVPTCTLVASTTANGSSSIAWTSTNATKADVYMNYGPIVGGQISYKYFDSLIPENGWAYINGEKVYYNISEGYKAGYGVHDFKVLFTGPGGSATCTASI